MKKKLVILGFVVLQLTGSYAQESQKKEAVRFSSSLYVGLLEGERGTAFQLQSITGFNRDKWFAGIGTGLDYYLFRSVPLFLSVNRYLKLGDQFFFLQGDAGINFPWVPGVISRDAISDKFFPGVYWNGGLGYATCLGKKRKGLLISLGYSYKEMKENREKQVICISPPCNPIVEKYDYHLRRISLRIGWEFLGNL